MEKLQSQLASLNATVNATAFNEYKEALKKTLLKKPINRSELVSKIWAEIVNGEYRFAREKDLAVEVEQITIEDLIRHFNDLVDKMRFRLLLLKTKSAEITAFSGMKVLQHYSDLKQEINGATHY